LGVFPAETTSELYPEIKAMFYFDFERPNENNNYAIKNTPVMNELYNKLVRENGIFA